MHDPYGLTNAEELRKLLQAADELVEELHVKPPKWAGMATDGGSVRHTLNGEQPPFRMGSNS